jgi:NodT family efflux transporter outer membrane factor (OMF) lipoprotein
MAVGAVAAAVLTLSGCVSYTGIHGDGKLLSADQLQSNAALPGQGGQWPKADWAGQFGDPQLEALIAEALADSPDLAEARARVAAARAYVQGADAKLLPSVGAQYSLNRELYSGNALYPPPYGGSWYTENNGLVSASYDLDLWGKNRQAVAQTLSREKTALADEAEVRLTLATSIAQTYNQLAREYELRKLAERVTDDRNRIGAITRGRVAAGLDNQSQQRVAEGDVATSRTTTAQIDGQIQVTRYELGALLGKGPDRGLAIAVPKLDAAGTELALPDRLPADLVARRPDLISALWQVDAATHGVKEAKAEFYPDVNLAAMAGFDSFGFAKFLNAGSREFQAGPAIHLPLFDAGALRANLRGEYANVDSAIASYNKTLVGALNDVATQVAQIQAVDNQIADAQKAYEASARNAELAQIRYRAKLTPELSVLSANLALLNQEQTLTDLKMSRRNLQIGLIKALGGGFDAAGTPLAPDAASAAEASR